MDGWKYMQKSDHYEHEVFMVEENHDIMFQSISPVIICVSEDTAKLDFENKKKLPPIEKFSQIYEARNYMKEKSHIRAFIVVASISCIADVVLEFERANEVKQILIYCDNLAEGKKKVQTYEKQKVTEAYNGMKKLTEGVKRALEKLKKDCSFFKRESIEGSNLNFFATLTMILKRNRYKAKKDLLELMRNVKHYFWLIKQLPEKDIPDNIEKIQQYPEEYSCDNFSKILPFMKFINEIITSDNRYFEQRAYLRLLVGDAYYIIRQNYIKGLSAGRLIPRENVYSFQKLTKPQLQEFFKINNQDSSFKYLTFRNFLKAERKTEKELQKMIEESKEKNGEKFMTLLHIQIQYPKKKNTKYYEEYNHGFYEVNQTEVWFNLLNVFEVVDVREEEFNETQITIIRLKYGIPGILKEKIENERQLKSYQNLLMKNVQYQEGITEKISSFGDILYQNNQFIKAYSHYQSEEKVCEKEGMKERKLQLLEKQAQINIIQGKFQQAGKNLYEGIQLSQHIDFSGNKTHLLSIRLKMSYQRMRNKKHEVLFKKTLEHYQQGIIEKYSKVQNHRKILALCHSNMLNEFCFVAQSFSEFEQFLSTISKDFYACREEEQVITAACTFALIYFKKKKKNITKILNTCSDFIKETAGTLSMSYIKWKRITAFVCANQNKKAALIRLQMLYKDINREGDRKYKLIKKLLKNNSSFDDHELIKLVEDDYKEVKSQIEIGHTGFQIPTEPSQIQ